MFRVMLGSRKKLLALAALAVTMVATLILASYYMHVPIFALSSSNPQVPLKQPLPASFQQKDSDNDDNNNNNAMHGSKLRATIVAAMKAAEEAPRPQRLGYGLNDDVSNKTAILTKTTKTKTTTTTTTTSAPARKRKRVVYSCSNFCGGWADRQKGIVAAHVLASMLGRDFGVHISVPCGLENFFDEGRVPWKVSDALLSGSREFKRLDHDAVTFTKDLLQERELENRFPDDVTVVTMNMEVVQFLQKHPAAASLGWVKGKPVPDVYKRSLEDLFVLKPSLRSVLQRLQDSRPSGTKLVCAQVRLGKQEGFPDVESFHSPEQFSNLVDFLRQYNDSSSYRIFFSSDNVAIMRRAREAFPAVYLDIPGPITHTDKSQGPEACEGFRKAILDEYALSLCDVLVHSESGIGKVASFMRGSDRGLFLFHDDKVEPFTRDGTFPNKVGW